MTSPQCIAHVSASVFLCNQSCTHHIISDHIETENDENKNKLSADCLFEIRATEPNTKICPFWYAQTRVMRFRLQVSYLPGAAE